MFRQSSGSSSSPVSSHARDSASPSSAHNARSVSSPRGRSDSVIRSINCSNVAVSVQAGGGMCGRIMAPIRPVKYKVRPCRENVPWLSPRRDAGQHTNGPNRPFRWINCAPHPGHVSFCLGRVMACPPPAVARVSVMFAPLIACPCVPGVVAIIAIGTDNGARKQAYGEVSAGLITDHSSKDYDVNIRNECHECVHFSPHIWITAKMTA